MIKRRSNISFSSRGGLLFILLLTVAMYGCKKETPPPAPVTPLPQKTVPAAAAPVVVAAPVKPLQTAPSSAKKTATPTSPATPVQAQVSTAKRLVPPGTVSLDFTNRRDPFKPFVQVQAQRASTKAGKPRTRDPLPIQRFDTEKFRVSGIVTGLRENSALITDQNGKGYVVRAGMPIGNNDGFVKRISSEAVEVEESFTDDNGRVRKRLVKLMLLRKK